MTNSNTWNFVNDLHLFSAKIAVYRKESNTIDVSSWQFRGCDLDFFVDQFPNLGACIQCIAKLRLDKKYKWFYILYFYVLLCTFMYGSISSKNLRWVSGSTNNHCLVTDGDGAMIISPLFEIIEFSPSVFLEFCDCWGVHWILIAAYDVCCSISSSSWVMANLS